jgi:type IV secretion system protein VirB10
MSAISAIAGSIVLALMVQGPANLQLSEIAKIPPPNVIPKGTVIPIQLIAKLSTKTLKEGDGVYGMTIFPITVNNEIVIPIGSSVGGKVTQVTRPGKVKGKAGLALSYQTLILPSGSTIPLYASLAGSSEATTSAEGKLEGESSKGDDVGTIAKTTAVPAVIGGVVNGQRGARVGAGAGVGVGLATVLLTRGKDIVLDRGSTLEIVLDRPLEP